MNPAGEHNINIKTLVDLLFPEIDEVEAKKKENTILVSIRRGNYTTARQVDSAQSNGKSKGHGGKIWQINICDPDIPEKIRIKHFDKLLGYIDKPALPAVTTSNLPVIATPKHLTVLDSTELTGKQDRIATARYALMKIIEKRPKHIKVTPYIRELGKILQNGTDEKLTSLANTANDRKGNREGVSFPTLMRWWTKHLACGKQANAMAPLTKTGLQRTTIIDWLDIYQPRTAAVAVLPVDIPAWLPYFLDEYRRPQKPSLHNSLKNICRTMPPDIERPSYDQIRRIMKKIPDIYAEKGRMTGAEYNSILGYVDRDASAFAPMSICQIDGHSFKAYVAHPVTGAHFHPEICAVTGLVPKFGNGGRRKLRTEPAKSVKIPKVDKHKLLTTISIDTRAPLKCLSTIHDIIKKCWLIKPNIKKTSLSILDRYFNGLIFGSPMTLTEPLSDEEIRVLRRYRASTHRNHCKKATAIMLANEGKTLVEIMESTHMAVRTIFRWLSNFNRDHLDSIKTHIKAPNREIIKAERQTRVIDILHKLPTLYDINRTSWTLEAIAEAYEKEYKTPISHAQIHAVIRNAKYSWRHARMVLTSPDPEYKTKVKRILETLHGLKEGDCFFFIDEVGPYRVKKYGGQKLSLKDQVEIITANHGYSGEADRLN